MRGRETSTLTRLNSGVGILPDIESTFIESTLENRKLEAYATSAPMLSRRGFAHCRVP